MKARFRMLQVQPDAYKAMRALEAYLANSNIDPLHMELIKIRASQINGCAFCVNMHIGNALKKGEKEQRLHLISVWREAENVFTEEERVLLEITEEVTLIHRHGLSDALYEKALQLFGEVKLAQILMVIVTINGWNRIAVSLKTAPEL
jgi:AhpD family alkylhydroperoxidase